MFRRALVCVLLSVAIGPLPWLRAQVRTVHRSFLEIVVVDEVTGEPCAGATVTCVPSYQGYAEEFEFGADPEGYARRRGETFVADANGIARLPRSRAVQANERSRLLFVRCGSKFGIHVSESHPADSLFVKLREDLTGRLRIVDEHGEPVVGYATNVGYRFPFLSRSVTDGDGVAVIRHLQMLPERAEFLAQPKVSIEALLQEGVVEHRLSATGSIEVTVSGIPAEIEKALELEVSFAGHRALVRDGRATLSQVEVIRYESRLVLRGPGVNCAHRVAQLKEGGEVVSVTLPFDSGGLMFVRLVDSASGEDLGGEVRVYAKLPSGRSLFGSEWVGVGATDVTTNNPGKRVFRLSSPASSCRSLRFTVVDRTRTRCYSGVVDEPILLAAGRIELGTVELEPEPVWAKGCVMGSDGEPISLPHGLSSSFGLWNRELSLFEPGLGRFELHGRSEKNGVELVHRLHGIGVDSITSSTSISRGDQDALVQVRMPGSIDAIVPVRDAAANSLRVRLVNPVNGEAFEPLQIRGDGEDTRFAFWQLTPATYRFEVMTLVDPEPLVIVPGVEIHGGRSYDARLHSIVLPKLELRTLRARIDEDCNADFGGRGLSLRIAGAWHRFTTDGRRRSLRLCRPLRSPYVDLLENHWGLSNHGIGPRPVDLDIEVLHRPGTFSGAWAAAPGWVPTWIPSRLAGTGAFVELQKLQLVQFTLARVGSRVIDDDARYLVSLRPHADVWKRHGVDPSEIELDPKLWRPRTRTVQIGGANSMRTLCLGPGTYSVQIERDVVQARVRRRVPVGLHDPDFVVVSGDAGQVIEIRIVD